MSAKLGQRKSTHDATSPDPKGGPVQPSPQDRERAAARRGTPVAVTAGGLAVLLWPWGSGPSGADAGPGARDAARGASAQVAPWLAVAAPTSLPPGHDRLKTRGEVAVDLALADGLLRENRHAEVVAKYLAMLEADADVVTPAGTGVVAEGDPADVAAGRLSGVWRPVADELQDRIGRLPDAALAIYRREVDAGAEAQFKDALAKGDLGGLTTVARRFPHSSSGPAALHAAAVMLFDRGEFGRAAKLLQRRLTLRTDDPPGLRAALSVRLAAALRLAGRAEAARQVAGKLPPESADAPVTLAGRRVTAGGAAEVMAGAADAVPPVVAHRVPGGSTDHPLWQGDPAGNRRSPAPEVLLRPLWVSAVPAEPPPAPTPERGDTAPAPQPAEGPIPPAVAGGTDPDELREQVRRSARHSARLSLRNFGAFADEPAGEPEWERPLPTVAGDTVYVRRSETLTALDLRTGRVQWTVRLDTSEPAEVAPPDPAARPAGPAPVPPVVPAPAPAQPAPLPGQAGFNNAEDEADTPERVAPPEAVLQRGRSSVTVVGDRLYLIEGVGALERLPSARTGDRPPTGFGNRLTCRARGDGRLLWHVGRRPFHGDERDQSDAQRLASDGTFLSAPTPADGRLHVAVLHRGAVHALCLSAEDGRPVWSRFLARVPEEGESSPSAGASVLALGSPPAVSGGSVYLLSNSGVMAAVDAADGNLEWVLLYRVAMRGQAVPEGAAFPRGRRRRAPRADEDEKLPFLPPNPLVISAGRLFALPSDSGELLCVDPAGGRLLWSAARTCAGRHQQWLVGTAGAGRDAVVLAGPDAMCLAAGTGEVRWHCAVAATGGRPAVSEECLLLPDQRQGLIRVRLADGAPRRPAGWSEFDPVTPEAGNLVAAGGRIVSAGDATTACYAAARHAVDEASRLAARFPKMAARRRQAGESALQAAVREAGFLTVAVREFESALETAVRAGDGAEVGLCRDRLARCRRLEAAGVEGGGAAVRLRRIGLLEQAVALACEPATEADVRLALARELASAGRGAEAAHHAEVVALLLPEVLLPAAPAAPSDAVRRPDDPPPAAMVSRGVARAMLTELERKHGSAVRTRGQASAEVRFAEASATRNLDRLAALRMSAGAESADRCRLRMLEILHEDELASRGGATGRAGGQPGRELAEAGERRRRMLWAEVLSDELLEPGRTTGPARAASRVQADALAAAWEFHRLRMHGDGVGDGAAGAALAARIAALPHDTPVSWGRHRGTTAGELAVKTAAACVAGSVPTRKGPAVQPADPAPVLVRLRAMRSDGLVSGWAGDRLVVGPDRLPVRIGDGVLVSGPAGLALMRPSDGAVIWRNDGFACPPELEDYGPRRPRPDPWETAPAIDVLSARRPFAVLTDRHLAVWDGVGEFAAFDPRTGKRTSVPADGGRYAGEDTGGAGAIEPARGGPRSMTLVRHTPDDQADRPLLVLRDGALLTAGPDAASAVAPGVTLSAVDAGLSAKSAAAGVAGFPGTSWESVADRGIADAGPVLWFGRRSAGAAGKASATVVGGRVTVHLPAEVSGSIVAVGPRAEALVLTVEPADGKQHEADGRRLHGADDVSGPMRRRLVMVRTGSAAVRDVAWPAGAGTAAASGAGVGSDGRGGRDEAGDAVPGRARIGRAVAAGLLPEGLLTVHRCAGDPESSVLVLAGEGGRVSAVRLHWATGTLHAPSTEEASSVGAGPEAAAEAAARRRKQQAGDEPDPTPARTVVASGMRTVTLLRSEHGVTETAVGIRTFTVHAAGGGAAVHGTLTGNVNAFGAWFTPRCVVVTAQQGDAGWRVWAWNTADGTRVWNGVRVGPAYGDGSGEGEQDAARRQAWAVNALPPAPMGELLQVESPEGVEVWGPATLAGKPAAER